MFSTAVTYSNTEGEVGFSIGCLLLGGVCIRPSERKDEFLQDLDSEK